MNLKRKNARLNYLSIPVEFRLGGEHHKGYITDLSETGAFMATNVAVPVKELLALRVFLPWDLGELSVRAVTQWGSEKGPESPGRGVGIAFQSLGEQDVEKLRSYMKMCFELVS